MKVCNRCLMDETDPQITFDENGYCNHCTKYFETAKTVLFSRPALDGVVDKIKKVQKGNKFDCVLGLSGGTDSSYVAYLAKELGLRTLLVHFDNGWNTPESNINVEAVVKGTNFEIITKTCDLEEYRDLQLAYLKSGVRNIEVITDHAIQATIFKIANEYDVKYLLRGTNLTTEGILPRIWGHRYNDLTNMKSIHSKHGSMKLKTYPSMSLLNFSWQIIVKGVKTVSPLNYLDYNRQKAIETLQSEWGYVDYGGKHCESILTRFFQNYILPTRWGIDKRRAHLSSLICSNQITRAKALEILKTPQYTEEEYRRDREVFIKKLRITDDELDYYLQLPKKKHEDYDTNSRLYNILSALNSAYISIRGKKLIQ